MQEASGAFHILLQAPKLCPELRSVAVFAQYIWNDWGALASTTGIATSTLQIKNLIGGVIKN